MRGVMIDLFGADRLIRDTNAQILDDHPEWGRLLGLGLNGDEPLVTVEVVNSTPEPDGLRKRYVLRVPPTTCTAREAIAWTFDLKPADYTPAAQT